MGLKAVDKCDNIDHRGGSVVVVCELSFCTTQLYTTADHLTSFLAKVLNDETVYFGVDTIERSRDSVSLGIVQWNALLQVSLGGNERTTIV
jgi:hypothetical protein